MTCKIYEVRIHDDGREEWRINGMLHRDNDLPAVVHMDGTKGWFNDGKLHRDNNLPAVIWANGTKEWFKDGEFHRDNDLPAWEGPDGSKEWFKDGKLHRDNDLPAIIWANGVKEWWRNGELAEVTEQHPDNCRNCELDGSPDFCGGDRANTEPYACDMCDRSEAIIASLKAQLATARAHFAAANDQLISDYQLGRSPR